MTSEPKLEKYREADESCPLEQLLLLYLHKRANEFLSRSLRLFAT